MTDRKYGILLAIYMAIIPGSFGVFSVVVGAYQGRIAPILVGFVLLAVACLVFKTTYNVAKERNPKDGS